MRALLKMLRAPYAVESADVDDALLTLAEGRLATNEKKSFFEVVLVYFFFSLRDEHYTSPRIKAVPFEKWYRKFYGQEELPT